jgi:hypothetical protein
MNSYLPFQRYVTNQGLFMEWNDETEHYDVVRKTYGTGLGFEVNSSIVVSIPPRTVRHNYYKAVETLDSALLIFRTFE